MTFETVATLTRFDVTFHAQHAIMLDLAADLTKTLDGPLGQPVDVFVAAHQSRWFTPSGRLRVALQTEQLYDEAGVPMLKAFRENRITNFINRFDAVLDFAYCNRPAYDGLSEALLAKVHFGPHIFPRHPRPLQPGGEALLFVGGTNKRRDEGLAAVSALQTVARAPEGTFGAGLDALIAASAGMVNIHLKDGTYTEYPRLLKAILHGKPFWSEALAQPLKAGEHYFDLAAQPDVSEIARVYNAATRMLAERYSFSGFLESLLASKVEKRA
jgi:hypothetical protein